MNIAEYPQLKRPITGKLEKAFFDIVNGSAPDGFGWPLPVEKR